jgi:hypothetical protein
MRSIVATQLSIRLTTSRRLKSVVNRDSISDRNTVGVVREAYHGKQFCKLFICHPLPAGRSGGGRDAIGAIIGNADRDVDQFLRHQPFNSLDSQREACEAYIVSQRHAGWIALSDMYDDGGLSGGTMERPALKRLLEDIEAGKVQIVVVYKIPWAWIATSSGGRLRLQIHSTWRRPMPLDHHSEEPTAACRPGLLN